MVARVLADMAEGVPDAPAVRTFTALPAALPGTDFIFSAIRVGGLEGRAADERIALEHGVIGQETVGAGGISYALRTIPVVLDIAESVKKHAPHAWFINFTNPAGVITEVMTRVLGNKVVGICDSPVGLARRCLLAAGIHRGAAAFRDGSVQIDYIGLNHLGWLRGLVVDGADVLPRLLADDGAIESFEEGRLFGASWIKALGAVPNEYLHYYYFRREALDADRRAHTTRGAYLARQQSSFYSGLAAANDGGAEPAQGSRRRKRLSGSGRRPSSIAKRHTCRATGTRQARSNATPKTWFPAATRPWPWRSCAPSARANRPD
ncbi:probable 6-phospho-beta-glucosidase [Arthrobacter sp. Hiyo8]|nr:probable 6-phospho-beta-glucosidase [Arthrobacter sp. Hiyo8]